MNQSRMGGVPKANGKSDGQPPPKIAAKVTDLLGLPMAEAYRPTLPIYTLRAQAVLGWEFFQDVEVMRVHPAIKMPLQWVMAPMRMAEWEMKASDLEAAKLAGDILLWWWNNALSQVHEEGSIYGWSGCEVVYKERGGYLMPCRTLNFSARDVCPVINPDTRVATGMQVSGGFGGVRRLWGFRENIPNKCFWYVHNGRFEGYYGDSQVRPSWKSWRGLAGIDGIEELTALGAYRAAVGIIKVRHPEGQYNGTVGVNVPSYSNDGKVMNYDIARQIGQTLKSGASLSLSSESYKSDMGGGYKWDVEMTPFQVDMTQLIALNDFYSKECARGIGVPPEVIQAAETGSGYSGRAIPLQGFLTSQQYPLHMMTMQVMEQIVCPLVRWNLGPDRWVQATPRPLIQTYRKTAWDQDSSGGQSGDTAGGNGQSQQQAVSGAGQPPFNGGSTTPGQPQG